MNKLKVMVKNEFESDRTLAGKIAKLIGYSNPTPLYKFLNEEEREIDFQQVLTIVQELFPDREFDIMSEYIRTLKPTQRCAREALEYASSNKIDDLFDYLTRNLESCSNKESQEWACIYKIHFNVLQGVTNRRDAIEIINGLSLKTNEMKVFSKIIQFYYYNDLKLVDIMKDMSFLIDNGLEIIKEGFIKNHYKCRFISIMASIHLHTNHVTNLIEKAEELSSKITNHNLLNIMYVLIGNSFLINDYNKAFDFYQKAVFHSEKAGNKARTDQAYKSINLLNSLWNMKKEFIEIDEDKDSLLADKAFNKCNFSKEEGLELLKQVDITSFSNHGKAFYYYYLGIASGQEDHFFESVEYFNTSGEKFFKKLPLIELEKMGIKKTILKALSV